MQRDAKRQRRQPLLPSLLIESGQGRRSRRRPRRGAARYLNVNSLVGF